MKKAIILILFSLISLCVFAQQETLDTAYYDSNWKASSKTFATYYRIINIPSQVNPRKQYRDYYITGELQGEGDYVTIDKQDDRNSIFDGDCISFYKTGKILEKGSWINSHKIGDFFEFYENTVVKTHCLYNNNGQIDGDYAFFEENGELSYLIHYRNGIPDPFLTRFNQFGPQGHYITTTMAYSPAIIKLSDMKTKILKGTKIYYYDLNGIYLSINIDAVKHYGKYYGIGISLFNNTTTSFNFYPEQIVAKGVFFKKTGTTEFLDDPYIADEDDVDFTYDDSKQKVKNIRVWKFNEYIKKVRSRQEWDKALVAMAEGLAASGSAYSTVNVNSTTSGPGGSYSTYSSAVIYDATASAIAKINAANNVATYTMSLERDMKTIYNNYLRATTLEPQTLIEGYVLLNKDHPNIIDLSIPVNGMTYRFHLTEIPK